MTWQQEFESSLREGYESRKLDEFIPELLPYLSSGMRVLDVGCGFGGLSMQVAQAVAPGAVEGIDPTESRIEDARAVSTERKLDNVSFSVGRAFSIDFPDNTFDLVYSNTVLHSLIDPVGALKEQKRVAKDRAWVVAAGVRDWGFCPQYPACPAVEKVREAWKRYAELLRQKYSRDHVVPGKQNRYFNELDYFDMFAGRQCPEWFAAAGLTEIDIRVRVFRVEHAGAEDMEAGKLEFLPARDGSTNPFTEMYRDMYAQGLLDGRTVAAAWREVEDWVQDPRAFRFWAFVFAAGRA